MPRKHPLNRHLCIAQQGATPADRPSNARNPVVVLGSYTPHSPRNAMRSFCIQGIRSSFTEVKRRVCHTGCECDLCIRHVCYLYVQSRHNKERVREMKSICPTVGRLPANVKQLTGFTIAIHPTPTKRRGQLPSDPLLSFRAAPAVDSLRQQHV